MLKTRDAADLLGVPAREIGSIASSPAGDVITTTDGTAYIVVPADTPDAEGKTGLMLLAAPSEASLVAGDIERGTITAWNGFPVFASDALTENETPAAAPPPADDVVDGLDALTLDELKAIAEPLDVKASGRSNQDKHDSLVAGIRAKRAELAGPVDGDTVRLAEIVAEVDELTTEELAERADALGIDVVEDRDVLVAAVAHALLAAETAGGE